MILPKIVTVTSRGSWSNWALPGTVAISLQQCHTRQCVLAAVSTATTETVGLTGDGNDSGCERTSLLALVIAITFPHCNNGKTEVTTNSRSTIFEFKYISRPKSDFKKFTLTDLHIYANKNFQSPSWWRSNTYLKGIHQFILAENSFCFCNQAQKLVWVTVPWELTPTTWQFDLMQLHSFMYLNCIENFFGIKGSQTSPKCHGICWNTFTSKVLCCILEIFYVTFS